MKDDLFHTLHILYRVTLVLLLMCFGYMIPAGFLVITHLDITQYSIVVEWDYYPVIGGFFSLILFGLFANSINIPKYYDR